MIPLMLALLIGAGVATQTARAKADDAYLKEFHPAPAPKPAKHFLRENDRLAICGDSITEQRKYSRIMEAYLTVCDPDLNISVRQYGWSGEVTGGFLSRMTNDCLRFKPTIATTCYGMNDHRYRKYEDAIGNLYATNTTAIVEAFKANGARVVLGSPGCVGKRPGWTGSTNSVKDDLNLNLCTLRNIDIEIAKKEHVEFADVFWPMLVADHYAPDKFGPDYAVAGKDGVHPDWAGHLVMAYAFLHAFGLDGDLGTFTMDLKSDKAKASHGHQIINCARGELQIKSSRYPFCIGDGDPRKDDNILSGTQLVPFNEELNRFMLVVKHAKAPSYKVTWGDVTKEFTGDQLGKGINLAKEFPRNPFSENFDKVDAAVAAKQAYETKQVKQLFRDTQAKLNMDDAAARTEKEREPLVEAIKAAFVPVTHTIKVVPVQ